MNRIDRLMGMLTVLQSKRYVTAEQLSDKFGTSVRTVYRDIKALGEIGVPVSFETHKGYFITQGYFLPPVSFTNDEANALVLMETIADKFGDRSIKQHYETALNKIKSVLKGSQKDKLEHLHSQIKIYKQPSPSSDQYLSAIQQAIANKCALNIDYQNNQLKKSNRDVEPIGLTYYGLSWHMIAWCRKRNEYRDFKVSHIQRLKETGTPFGNKQHIDINQYIKSLH